VFIILYAGVRCSIGCSPVDFLGPILTSLAPDMLQSIKALELNDGTCRWNSGGNSLKQQKGKQKKGTASCGSLPHDKETERMFKELMMFDLTKSMLLVMQPLMDHGEAC